MIADPLAASKSHVYVAAAAAKTLHAETLRRVPSLPTASSRCCPHLTFSRRLSQEVSVVVLRCARPSRIRLLIAQQ